MQQILQRYPGKFAVPKKLTDRKPGKGDKDVPADIEFVKADQLTKLAAQGQLVWSQQDATGSTVAVTADSLNELAAAGEQSSKTQPCPPNGPGTAHCEFSSCVESIVGYHLKFLV